MTALADYREHETSNRDLRALLRERLFRIVGINCRLDRPAVDGRVPQVSMSNFCTALLFDQRIDDLDIHDAVASIRLRHPHVHVTFLDRCSDHDDLPCEFGTEQTADRGAGGSPVAEAAVSHWRLIERSLAVARAINRICATHLAAPPRTA